MVVFRKRRRRRSFLPVLKISAVVLVLALFILLLFILPAGNSSNADTPETVEEIPPEAHTPLVLVWEFAAIGADPESIGPMPGLDIVSPTWFHIIDEEGTIDNQVNPAYIAWARERGYEIWALVTNSFDPELTVAILSDETVRIGIVEDLIALALEYELDGLNIDFENFHGDYCDLFTLFMTELSRRCLEEGLVLSVDVTMISSSDYWSRGYDRAALAEVCDYVMLMAYDEHWGTSPVAGSVSSLPWVENGLQLVLLEVPADKLILGIPFYTRLFEVDESGVAPVVLNSWSFSMMRAAEIMEENDAAKYWDSEAKQHVARYEKDGLTYIMWLEDRASMHYRLELVDRYNLAGVAGWRRGLEKPEIWDLIDDRLHPGE